MKKNGKFGTTGIVVIFILGLLVLFGFQHLMKDRGADVSFTHQLEHLVNLDLVHPSKNKKVALNENLVSFSGLFREKLSQTAMDRFRYLTLLKKSHELSSSLKDVSNQITHLSGDLYSAANYFFALTGLGIDNDKLVIIPEYGDDPKSSIVVYPSSIKPLNVTLPKVRELYENTLSLATPSKLDSLDRSMRSLSDSFLSFRLGIGDENMKSQLREAERLLNGSESGGLSRMDIYGKSIKTFGNVSDTLYKVSNGVRLFGLRSVRNYLEYMGLYITVKNDLVVNKAQLGKSREKVADVIWFFNNEELTTTALESIDQGKYSQWFASVQSEWESFVMNQGKYFSAPDQPRSMVLDKRFKSEEVSPNYFGYLFTFLPIIFVGFFLYMIFTRQVKGVGSSAMGFGKSPAKLLNTGAPKVTFADVAGIEEAKEELEEVVDFLRDPTRFTNLGARIPKGVLLIGPPGTGKTLTAKAVAGEAGVPFFSISGSDFVEMFVGVGASRVRDLFDQAKKHSPCIVFIDEIDAVGRHRGSGLGGGHDEREQTLNQLLVEIDGMSSSEGVIIIAATNRPDVLDTALLRPGRFDRSVIVELPDVMGRLAILKVHVKGVKLSEDVDLKEIANRTPGVSGADLRNIINEAALYAAKKMRRAVTQDDLRYAQEKVQLGKERKSLIRNEDDKRSTAWHEAGHALIALHLNTSDKVSKVTCIARGHSLGATHFEEKSNRVNYKKTELLDKLVVLMGGRVAEEMLNQDPSNGAQMDIKQATTIARSMVTEWGMSDKLGMVNFSENNKKTLMAGFQEREYSERTAVMIDEEIRSFLTASYDRAKEILKENHDKLKEMSEALFEFETLERDDLERILQGTWDREDKIKKIKEMESMKEVTPPPLPVNRRDMCINSRCSDDLFSR